MSKLSSSGIWFLASCVAILSPSITQVQAQVSGIDQLGIPLYEVPDLMTKSHQTPVGTIAVSGILQCEGPTICWFEDPTRPKQHLMVDVSQVSPEDKQDLLSCVASPCGELLIGRFDRIGRGLRFRMLRW